MSEIKYYDTKRRRYLSEDDVVDMIFMIEALDRHLKHLPDTNIEIQITH